MCGKFSAESTRALQIDECPAWLTFTRRAPTTSSQFIYSLSLKFIKFLGFIRSKNKTRYADLIKTLKTTS